MHPGAWPQCSRNSDPRPVRRGCGEVFWTAGSASATCLHNPHMTISQSSCRWPGLCCALSVVTVAGLAGPLLAQELPPPASFPHMARHASPNCVNSLGVGGLEPLAFTGSPEQGMARLRAFWRSERSGRRRVLAHGHLHHPARVPRPGVVCARPAASADPFPLALAHRSARLRKEPVSHAGGGRALCTDTSTLSRAPGAPPPVRWVRRWSAFRPA